MEQEKVLGVAWGMSQRRACLLNGAGQLLRSQVDGAAPPVDGDLSASLTPLLDRLHMESGRLILSGARSLSLNEDSFCGPEVQLASLGARLRPVELRLGALQCFAVPGWHKAQAGDAPDYLMGEETFIHGARLLGAPDGWFVLPDTHSKWVRVADGRIVDIATFMTGELFAALARHTSLAPLLHEAGDAPAAFDAGVQAAQESGLSHSIFGCRALVEWRRLPAAHGAAYLYGLLVGAELADMRRRSPLMTRAITQVIGAPELATRHVRALSGMDMRSMTWPPDAVYAAALYDLAGL